MSNARLTPKERAKALFPCIGSPHCTPPERTKRGQMRDGHDNECEIDLQPKVADHIQAAEEIAVRDRDELWCRALVNTGDL